MLAAAESILKESKYSDAIFQRQNDEKFRGFEKYEIPDWYIHNHEPTAEGGISKGLKVIVDAHSDRLSPSTVTDNSRGFVTIIQDKNSFPMASITNLMSRPGYESNIKLTAIHIQAEQEIKEYSAVKRNCYFPDEYPLQMHQIYSQSNCILECGVRFAKNCISKCPDLHQNCTCRDTTSEYDTPVVSHLTLVVLITRFYKCEFYVEGMI